MYYQKINCLKKMMTKGERFLGCIIGGAIGDAFGSGYENLPKDDDTLFCK